MEAQLAGFRQRWDETHVVIIALHGTDIGWFQSFVKEDMLFLAQLFVDRALRGQGTGTAVVKILDRGGSESRSSLDARRSEKRSSPAALRAPRVSRHARG